MNTRLEELVDALTQKPPFRYLDRAFEIPGSPGTLGGIAAFDGRADRYQPSDGLPFPFVVECLAQLSSVFLRNMNERASGGLLVSIDSGREYSFARLPASICLRISLRQMMPPFFIFDGAAECDGRIIGEATITVRANVEHES